MNIEVVDFFPAAKKKPSPLVGTLHIYLCDLNLDIRGIPVYRTTKDFFIKMPGGRGIDHETGAPVEYPIVNFTDPEKQRELIKAIRKLAIPFIQERLKEIKAA